MGYEVMQTSELRATLAHFTGCEQPFRHSVFKDVLYTGGAQCFFQNAQAYWFLDILATQPEIRSLAKNGFAYIVLSANNGKGSINVSDNSGEDRMTVFTQDLDFTTCPDGEWQFYFVSNMIMLPQEY